MELDFKFIGQRIKIARIKKKLTQEVLSEKINVSPQHVSNIETGNSSVSLPTLVAIANTLGVSVDELLCDTILSSKAVFENELEEVLRDCNEYEIRFITDIVKASKKSIRDIKLFQSNLNDRY
ncbi:TPA: helix-turn-helix transcriptional regulator [Clostridioides difficile]|jgi:transcriptional regulator with XRE-family HTH domain|uniref:HTH-type transcriptional regulator n=11 Tax=Clostridioides difficile TaxID=1496 RepID=A0AB74QH66_CLODI|nr:helix-turn-helix transcriptional regulator [Clostridioides difficile]EQG73037.1 helix-turn-helix family protein [Clostridioides difficile DA00165]OFU31516.1 transcriptional regulator [Clostridium sp. HMSC19B12]HBR0068580.1 helix-turn-helix transcriptional regulator [Klebsiella pneumoniae]HBR0841088.1 helix-turn-helix transcriptional regulator [Klebsiella quasipneumoniae]AUG89589.1 Cro/C1-type HTH domain profile [Clostridioides difficile]